MSRRPASRCCANSSPHRPVIPVALTVQQHCLHFVRELQQGHDLCDPCSCQSFTPGDVGSSDAGRFDLGLPRHRRLQRFRRRLRQARYPTLSGFAGKPLSAAFRVPNRHDDAPRVLRTRRLRGTGCAQLVEPFKRPHLRVGPFRLTGAPIGNGRGFRAEGPVSAGFCALRPAREPAPALSPHRRKDHPAALADPVSDQTVLSEAESGERARGLGLLSSARGLVGLQPRFGALWRRPLRRFGRPLLRHDEIVYDRCLSYKAANP